MPIITVDLLKGRSVEQKRAFAQQVTQNAVTVLHCRKEDVKIIFHELTPHDLSDGGVLRGDCHHKKD